MYKYICVSVIKLQIEIVRCKKKKRSQQVNKFYFLFLGNCLPRKSSNIVKKNPSYYGASLQLFTTYAPLCDVHCPPWNRKGDCLTMFLKQISKSNIHCRYMSTFYIYIEQNKVKNLSCYLSDVYTCTIAKRFTDIRTSCQTLSIFSLILSHSISQSKGS